MITVHKYALRPGQQLVEMPLGAEVLTARWQRREAQLWARIDTERPRGQRMIAVVPTGGDAPDIYVKYAATFETPHGLIFHVFDGGFRT